MAEEKAFGYNSEFEIRVKVCSQGFVVVGGRYGGAELRAFSTAEGLIEWLAKELGAGPIVWWLTLPIWAKEVEVEVENLLPLPDPITDPSGYQKVQEENAKFLLSRFAEKYYPPAPPKPAPTTKPKKAKKPKKEAPKKEVKEE